MEFFLNPWTMTAGGLLITSPIIIHLINRMRFKRIRWAAMEFLLKSQKRNRRRLIIEQLILLLLRILLVLLAGLIFGRLAPAVFGGLTAQQTTKHIILLDDSASMGDAWREGGESRTVFGKAKDFIVDGIGKNALQAQSAQSIEVIMLSDPEAPPIKIDRLDSSGLEELRRQLTEKQVTAQHVPLTKALERVARGFNEQSAQQRILHVVSDFRQRDWNGPEADGMIRDLKNLAEQSRVKVNFVDVAVDVENRYRSENQKTALHHDNVGLVELRPESKVAAKFQPMQFFVTVHNFSASERSNVRVTVKVNGGERAEGSLTIDRLPPNAPTTKSFFVSFDRSGLNQITANLENEEAGLQVDNTRFAVVEVREQVPILVIDGDLTNSRKPGGDGFHMESLFDTFKGAQRGYSVVFRGPSELLQPNLDQYPSIYIFNVKDLPVTDNKKAIRNLETYVREGGGLAFFLGDKVDPAFYNRELWNEGKGVFPAPLADRPSPELTEEEKTERMLANLLDPQFQIFLRSETHPVFKEVYSYRGIFKFLTIERYHPVIRGRWNPEPGTQEELVTLPNRNLMSNYNDRARELLTKIQTDEPDVLKYKVALNRHSGAIKDVMINPKAGLHNLANAVGMMLADEGDAKDRDTRPNLKEFWDLPKNQSLKRDFEIFKDTVQYGDPLVLDSKFGKGRVLTFLTTAGQKWNNWAGGFPMSATYPIIMIEGQKYLTGGAGEGNLFVGDPLIMTVDSTRFEPKMQAFYMPEAKDDQPAPKGEVKPDQPVRAGNLQDYGPVQGEAKGGRITFSPFYGRKPGIYVMELSLRGDPAQPESRLRTEQRGFSFNVDPKEMDLKRASRDDLAVVPGARLLTPDSDWIAELAVKQEDFSKTIWPFLIIFVVLVIEQALAVHLSFHLKGTEAQMASQAVTPHALPAETAAPEKEPALV